MVTHGGDEENWTRPGRPVTPLAPPKATIQMATPAMAADITPTKSVLRK